MSRGRAQRTIIGCLLIMGSELTIVDCGSRAPLIPHDAGLDLPSDSATVQTPEVDASVDEAPIVRPTGMLVPYVDVTKTTGSCSAGIGSPIVPTSASEVVSLLLGRWKYCEGLLPIGSAPGGMEFRRNRQWLGLRDSEGTLLPSTAPDSAGFWFLATEDPPDPINPAFDSFNYLQLVYPDSQVAPGLIEISQNPTRLRLSQDYGASYVWLGD